MKALCFGSLNIDYTYSVPHFVRKGETLASTGLKIFSGGKGLNQAIALARAGAETFHAGAVGEDGLFLVEQLRASGVDISFVRVLENIRTGHAIIQNDAEGDNCIMLFGGANRAIGERQIDETLEHFSPGDVLMLQNEISGQPYLLERARRAGMRIALNPSPMEAGILEWPLDTVDCFILNEGEAGAILGVETRDGEALLKGLSERFPGAEIVLTLGAEGSAYSGGGKVIFQPAYPAEAVDTTGAGDTFTGYFLAERMRGAAPEQAMKTASGAASIAVSRPGASPSIPELEEVLKYIREETV